MSILFSALTAGAAGNEWVERMDHTYTQQMDANSRSRILNALRDTPVEARAWVGWMAQRYITAQMNGNMSYEILFALRQAPVEAQMWMEHMAQRYITPQMDTQRIWKLFSILGNTPMEAREWFERMAQTYITDDQMDEFSRVRFFDVLGQTPVEAQMWMEHMAQRYTMNQIDEYSSMIFVGLSRTPMEAREWFERMAQRYIPAQMDGFSSSQTLAVLRYTSVEASEWFERMAQTYITAQMDGDMSYEILDSLSRTPVAAHGWMEHLVTFLRDPRDPPEDVVLVMSNLSSLTQSLPTPALLEQARLRLVAGVNQEREEERLLQAFLPDLTTRIRDELTQQADMNPGAARPMGRAMEVHFASALGVPLEDGRTVPLYKAVESRLHSLGIGNEMTLVNAVSIVQGWVDAYADEGQRDLYHRVVTKGYGDGRNPSYNQEITPLLRFVVQYMNRLDQEGVRSAWLLPALQESATAYDQGDALSCAKGVQERLTVVGLDVEGVDPVLRSLSKFARDFLYITDPTTHGADRWVKTVVSHLTSDERGSLLGAEKPGQEAFEGMFLRVLPRGLQQTGLLPLHTEALLKDSRVQESFKNSLEMHYEYEEHYEALQAKVRELQVEENKAAQAAKTPAQTPEERRDLMARTAERRLAKAETLPEDRVDAA